MYTLAFDTTGNVCSLILLQDNDIVYEFSQECGFGQAETLMLQIQNLLQKKQLQIKDLSTLAVCTGPGSFTGVRSSIAAARSFALACPEVTVCGINAFDAYVSTLSQDELADINAVIIETKREDFYIHYYDRNLHKLEAPSASSYEDIIRRLSGKKTTLIGDGVERFLSRPSGLSLHAVKLCSSLPIEALGRCAINKYNAKTADFPKPLYLKAPDVCVK